MTDSEPKDQRVPVSMSRSELDALDIWRRAQDDLPGRSEAIRRMMAMADIVQRAAGIQQWEHPGFRAIQST